MSKTFLDEAGDATALRVTVVQSEGTSLAVTSASAVAAAPWVTSVLGSSNAVATATKEAVSGKTHSLATVSYGFTASVLGVTLTIKAGATTLAQVLVGTNGQLQFDPPIVGTLAAALSAELGAAGIGIGGSLLLTGTTI